jgi:hypothetical protein
MTRRPTRRALRRELESIKDDTLRDALGIEHPTTRILTMSREQANRTGLEILGPAEDAEDDDAVRVAVVTGPSMETDSYTTYFTDLKPTDLGLEREPTNASGEEDRLNPDVENDD